MPYLRFISESQYTELINYYHLARCALSDRPYQEQNKHNRMIQACKWFHKEHPTISETAAYKDLSANLQGY